MYIKFNSILHIIYTNLNIIFVLYDVSTKMIVKYTS